MRIVEITYQNRRDFAADMECEGCGHTCKLTRGYDDRFYHDNVIPAMPCPKCGKSRNDLGIVAEQTQTRYPEGYQV